MKKAKSDVVMPVCEFTEPIGRALQVKDGNIKMLKSANKFKRTQDLDKRYFDAGRFYFINTSKFKKNKTFFPLNCSAIITDRMLVQDVDEMDDWRLLELKYKIYTSHGSRKFQKNI
jgi:N-acylneuraminate cytidylyltransferase